MSCCRIIKPGQKGTRKMTEQYGDRMRCVRYIYDDKNQIKLKTIEIIIEKNPWHKDTKRISGNKLVSIKVDYGEIQIGRMIRAAGGRWDREKLVWLLPYREAKALGLDKRIVND